MLVVIDSVTTTVTTHPVNTSNGGGKCDGDSEWTFRVFNHLVSAKHIAAASCATAQIFESEALYFTLLTMKTLGNILQN